MFEMTNIFNDTAYQLHLLPIVSMAFSSTNLTLYFQHIAKIQLMFFCFEKSGAFFSLVYYIVGFC